VRTQRIIMLGTGKSTVLTLRKECFSNLILPKAKRPEVTAHYSTQDVPLPPFRPSEFTRSE
jgi:hypothetical protein